MSREGPNSGTNNNENVLTGQTAQPGATITATIQPRSMENTLTVSVGGAPPVISTAPVASTDDAQQQSFSFSGQTSDGGPVSINVGSKLETRGRPDSWNLSVTVQNPFTVDPMLIVRTDTVASSPK